VRRTRILAVATLAILNVFTLAAAAVVAHMLPPRLARLKIPVAASGPVVRATPVLPAAAVAGDGASGAGVSGEGAAGTGQPAATAPMPTQSGLSALIAASLPDSQVGPGAGVLVADAATGQVLYSRNGYTAVTPASTTKVVTAAAALAALGPDARFTTSVKQVPGGIVLVGGGDPTLAVNDYPSSDYPQPATLATLAARTATALKAAGRGSVQLGYDTSLFTGPDMAPGWVYGLVHAGNVTPISALEADQGRLTPGGGLEDRDDPVNYRPRTLDPAGMTAQAFAALLAKDGIRVTGTPSAATAPAGAATVAQVSSPVLASIVEQMLQESNNVIAENLARHVAIATGQPATFAGAAASIMAEVRQFGISTQISLVDGSGLSPQDAIAPVTLVRVLEFAAASARARAAITGLPIAGFTGTLSPGRSVFGGITGTARGVVRAKTGNLTTVATLAGLVTDRSGRLLVFAIMAPQVPASSLLQPAATAINNTAAALAGLLPDYIGFREAERACERSFERSGEPCGAPVVSWGPAGAAGCTAGGCKNPWGVWGVGVYPPVKRARTVEP
jgi:serine-type D-Ala-D-Ala carboxypeptidase/endopeptidase (penicillin-binding protein 4)